MTTKTSPPPTDFDVPPSLPHRSTVPLEQRTLTDWEDDALVDVDEKALKRDVLECLDNRIGRLFGPFPPYWNAEEDQYGVRDQPFSEGSYKKLGKQAVGLGLYMRAIWRINKMRKERDLPELNPTTYARTITSKRQQAKLQLSASIVDEISANSRDAADGARRILAHVHSAIDLEDAIETSVELSRAAVSTYSLMTEVFQPVLSALQQLESTKSPTKTSQLVRRALGKFDRGEVHAKAALAALERAHLRLGLQPILVRPGEPFDPGRFYDAGSVYTDLYPGGSAVVEADMGWTRRGRVLALAPVWVVRGPLADRIIPQELQEHFDSTNALWFELSEFFGETLEQQAARALAHLEAKQLATLETQVRERIVTRENPGAPPAFILRISVDAGRGGDRGHRKE